MSTSYPFIPPPPPRRRERWWLHVLLLLVTVAGHLTNIPALVLPPDTAITLRLVSRYPAALSIDGQVNIPVESVDVVEVTRSPLACRFARVHPRAHFYETLTSRLRRG